MADNAKDAAAQVTSRSKYPHLAIQPTAIPPNVIPDPIALLGRQLKVMATLARATSAMLETDIQSWGYGVEGSLGHDRTVNCEFPTPVTTFRHTTIQQCAAGRHLSLFLNDQGQVFQTGKMSDRITASHWKPKLIAGLPRILTTAAGDKACYAISAPSRTTPHHVSLKATSDTPAEGGGVLYAWGCGILGQLGHGTEVDQKVPRPVTAFDSIHITLVRAGFHFAAAISDAGHLYTWGCGRHGQLGHNATTNEVTPRRVERLLSVTDVSLGSTHVLAISGPLVYSWGQNLSGSLGIGGDDRDVLIPTEVMFFRHMQATKVAAGTDHSLVVRHMCVCVAKPSQLCVIGVKTHVYACGSNRFGQLGINMTVSHSDYPQCIEEFEYASLSRRVAQIQAGDRVSVALLVTGEVLAWGDGTYGKTGHSNARKLTCVPWPIEAINHRFALHVAVGHSHTLALFRRDDKTMDRFRNFQLHSLASHLTLREASHGDASGCLCVHATRSTRAPFGLYYLCATCNLEPLCRWCSRQCHAGHDLQWTVLESATSYHCTCTNQSTHPMAAVDETASCGAPQEDAPGFGSKRNDDDVQINGNRAYSRQSDV
ncbi:Aste57867_23157 [Aphanomyces stellatus]|uniref:Aste57867_23157 protein n=1 Tax=Aphanomyces stellatus TaxID=120398 RepID=A0A485LMT6_9STRA|nr:hypothetical protein As57867_023086 [Aphanomyces stellatus]VFT99805.1 Aste57867_23157 [Aphanomyces stellatus]